MKSEDGDADFFVKIVTKNLGARTWIQKWGVEWQTDEVLYQYVGTTIPETT